MTHHIASAPRHPWIDHLFSAKATRSGGIVRRAVCDVEREVGRERFFVEVQSRGFHVMEWGDQFIILCSKSRPQLHI
ncbi:N-(5'-phosphoribosyl)anthranilate isomerase [uncultured Litoreibacter sp.]|uniref:N-(5'-phosphoribosyl)anthranilate isomerase n=1 Tax=uncultured Litoreibacter sp. TaxID=1392394 RepID=UPI002630AD63|nr:N-(5'-phosphoribosyl)anthranilate isomerase [uncultured Litoreibacter sp.]